GGAGPGHDSPARGRVRRPAASRVQRGVTGVDGTHMKTVFFDIDTQIDFLFPAGALYVPGAERIVPTVSKLNHYAAAHGIVVVSDMCAHAENDPEFRDWPPHCIVGTTGQLKPASTMLSKRAVVPNLPAEIAVEG